MTWKRVLAAPSLFAFAASLRATSVIPISDQELYRRASVVVHGVVLSSRAELGPAGFVETVTEIQILETFKSQASGNLMVRTVGGRLADGQETGATGWPQYRLGQEVVVFATRDPEGQYRVTEFLLGKFEVWVDGRGEKFAMPALATPDGQRVRVLEIPAQASDALAPRHLTSFLSSLREGRLAGETAVSPAGELRPSSLGYAEDPEWSIVWQDNGPVSYRWQSSSPVTVQADLGPVSGGACFASQGAPGISNGSDGGPELNAALATWNSDVARSGPRFVSGVVTGAGVRVFPNTDHIYGWWNGPAEDGVIALTFPAPLSCIVPTPPFATHVWQGRTFRTLANPSVYMRSRGCWSSKHYRAVLTHELGHALGFWHSREFGGAVPIDTADSCATDTWESIMQGMTPIQDYLGADDIAGLRFLYAADATPLACNAAPPGRPSYPDSFDWVDEQIPTNATVVGSFTWDSVHRVSQEHSHTDGLATGVHQHYFYGASQTMTVGQNDILTCYVWLDPCHPPQEVMLQWNDGTWEHRAFWGTDVIPWGGAPGSPAHTDMGPLPPTGQWVLLEVPASFVDLSGHLVNGMAFGLVDGQGWFDRAGLRPKYKVLPPQPGLCCVIKRGPTAGGTRVVIPGNNFVAGASVTFGGVASTSVNVDSPSQITAVTPPHSSATVDILVTNPDGQSGYFPNVFTYVDLAPVYQGYLDLAACDVIAGWAWDANYPTTPVSVDIYADGLKVATVAANAYRGDLVNAGIGDGYHGFWFATPTSIRTGGFHAIDVRFAGASSLIGSPRSVTCTDVATFVSQSVPSTMTPGSTATVTVTMRNSGTTVWTESDSIRLGSQNPDNNATWGLSRVYLAAGETVAAGASKTFQFTITAPAAPGTYNFQWRMVREMIRWFGDWTPNVAITVGQTVPQPPTGCSPNGVTLAAGTTSVTLTCAPTPGATKYAVRLQDNTDGSLRGPNNCPGNPAIDICVNDIAASSYTAAVVSGHSYTWWMHAGNSVGYSTPTYSNFSVGVDSLHAPTGLYKEADPSRNLGWTPPDNLTGADQVSYVLVFQGASPGASCPSGCSFSPGAPSWYTIGPSMAPGTYWWTLQAKSSSRPYSAPVNGPPFTLPGLHAPTGLYKEASPSRNLVWTPPDNLTGADGITYDLWITGGANCASGCLYHPGAPSWYTMGAEITPGTYSWTLKANSVSRPSSGAVPGPSFTMP